MEFLTLFISRTVQSETLSSFKVGGGWAYQKAKKKNRIQEWMGKGSGDLSLSFLQMLVFSSVRLTWALCHLRWSSCASNLHPFESISP